MTVTDSNGLVWENGGEATDDHLSHGGHETALVDIARALLPENGVFLDVGAHVGLYSLNLAKKASTVYAIEANPATYAVLQKNLRANRVHVTPTVLSAVCVAAWDEITDLDLIDANDKETGGSTRCVEIPEKSKITPKTHAAPLDTILAGRQVDLVKIDVEGAEARVLRGLDQTIESWGPTLFIEMHDRVYDLPDLRQEVFEILESHNYTWDDNLQHGEECYYVVATPSDVTAVGDWIPEVVKAGDSGPVDPRYAASVVAHLIEEDKA